MAFGKELILNLGGCDASFSKDSVKNYFSRICELIEMEPVGKPVFYSFDEKEEHLQGLTAFQVIKTSNITLHTADPLKSVFINIFSCKDFDVKEAESFSKEFFRAERADSEVFERK